MKRWLLEDSGGGRCVWRFLNGVYTFSTVRGWEAKERRKIRFKNLTKQGDEHKHQILVVTINVNGLNPMLSPNGLNASRGKHGREPSLFLLQ